MNPTGLLLEDKFLKEIASLGVPVISDEIYHGLVYEGRARSILEFTDQAFVMNGISKRFAMTGLRLGYVIAPKSCKRALQKLQQNLFICAPSIAQQAGIAALRHAAPDVEQMRATYDERRRYMIQRLREMGFGIRVEPKGAFYIFADARKFTKDSYKFAFEVLEQAHVGITRELTSVQEEKATYAFRMPTHWRIFAKHSIVLIVFCFLAAPDNFHSRLIVILFYHNGYCRTDIRCYCCYKAVF